MQFSTPIAFAGEGGGDGGLADPRLAETLLDQLRAVERQKKYARQTPSVLDDVLKTAQAAAAGG